MRSYITARILIWFNFGNSLNDLLYIYRNIIHPPTFWPVARTTFLPEQQQRQSLRRLQQLLSLPQSDAKWPGQWSPHWNNKVTFGFYARDSRLSREQELYRILRKKNNNHWDFMLRWILDLIYRHNISLNVFTPSNCTYQKFSQCWTRPDQCHSCLGICGREEPNRLQGGKTPRFVLQISGSHYP